MKRIKKVLLTINSNYFRLYNFNLYDMLVLELEKLLYNKIENEMDDIRFYILNY